MKKSQNIFMVFFVLCFFVLGLNGAWATDGTQKWAFDAGNSVTSSPAIGADGTIYVGSYASLGGGNLYAINPDGTQKWVYNLNGVKASPAIGADGTIYVGSYDPMGGGNLYAINLDGTQKWVCSVGNTTTSPAIGLDGTIYVAMTNGGLKAIGREGKPKWWFPTSGDIATSSPAVGADGTIYMQAYTNFYAINPDGTQKWVFEVWNQYASPAIGSDGTIYCGDTVKGKLYALNPEDGTQKWAFSGGFGMESSPAIGPDGTIFTAIEKYLYALNPEDGTQEWAFSLGDGISHSSPAIGADGTIYVGAHDHNVYAANPDGTRKWNFRTGDVVNSSPAIGPDGTIYVGSDDNNLYAINGSSGGLAHTAWPMFHRDLRHTGLNATPPVPDIKANGHDGSISVSLGAAVSITVALNAGSFAGQNADWWVVEKTPSGAWNHFDLATHSMVSGLAPTHQGALFNLGTTQLLNTSDLSAGSHIFYFGVDLNMSGTLDMDSIYHDSVNVTVQPQ